MCLFVNFYGAPGCFIEWQPTNLILYCIVLYVQVQMCVCLYTYCTVSQQENWILLGWSNQAILITFVSINYCTTISATDTEAITTCNSTMPHRGRCMATANTIHPHHVQMPSHGVATRHSTSLSITRQINNTKTTLTALYKVTWVSLTPPIP